MLTTAVPIHGASALLACGIQGVGSQLSALRPTRLKIVLSACPPVHRRTSRAQMPPAPTCGMRPRPPRTSIAEGGPRPM